MESYVQHLQLTEGIPLPSPELLKGKILIKDKKVRRGAGNSTTSLLGGNAGTLQRGTHLPSVPEEMESMSSGDKKKKVHLAISTVQDVPVLTTLTYLVVALILPRKPPP